MKITISNKAYFEICDSLSFLSRVSKAASQKLYEEIHSKLEALKEFPFIYPLVNSDILKNLEIRKMNVDDGRYGILYSVKEDEIYVYRFLDLRKENIFSENDFNKL